MGDGDVGRRNALTIMALWAAAGFIGNGTYDIFKGLGRRTSKALRKAGDEAIDKLLGADIQIPVWTGSRLLGVLFRCTHDVDGFLLTGRSVCCEYENGVDCARVAKPMIDTALLLLAHSKLRLRVNLDEVDWMGVLPEGGQELNI